MAVLSMLCAESLVMGIRDKLETMHVGILCNTICQEHGCIFEAIREIDNGLNPGGPLSAWNCMLQHLVSYHAEVMKGSTWTLKL